MEKNYKEIEFEAGEDIDSAVRKLQKHTDLVCGMFNGQMLYSDVDDVDSAYRKITGMTKAEFEYSRKKTLDEYRAREEKHKAAIPKLTQEYIEKGKEVLDEKYQEYWNECVPIRLNDLYEGMELDACLEIIKELNNGCNLDTAKSIIENQGHSGMSFNLVRAMVASFCDRGVEFASYVNQ